MRVPIAPNVALLLAGPGVTRPEEVGEDSALPPNWQRQSGGNTPAITVDVGALDRGLQMLWLDELKVFHGSWYFRTMMILQCMT